MSIYLVTYDLVKPGRNYDRLYEALESVPHCRPLRSVWFIQHEGGAGAIRDWLKGHVDDNDRLFVTRQRSDWAGWRMQNQCGGWLNRQEL